MITVTPHVGTGAIYKPSFVVNREEADSWPNAYVLWWSDCYWPCQYLVFSWNFTEALETLLDWLDTHKAGDNAYRIEDGDPDYYVTENEGDEEYEVIRDDASVSYSGHGVPYDTELLGGVEAPNYKRSKHRVINWFAKKEY